MKNLWHSGSGTLRACRPRTKRWIYIMPQVTVVRRRTHSSASSCVALVDGRMAAINGSHFPRPVFITNTSARQFQGDRASVTVRRHFYGPPPPFHVGGWEGGTVEGSCRSPPEGVVLILDLLQNGRGQFPSVELDVSAKLRLRTPLSTAAGQASRIWISMVKSRYGVGNVVNFAGRDERPSTL